MTTPMTFIHYMGMVIAALASCVFYLAFTAPDWYIRICTVISGLSLLGLALFLLDFLT